MKRPPQRKFSSALIARTVVGRRSFQLFQGGGLFWLSETGLISLSSGHAMSNNQSNLRVDNIMERRDVPQSEGPTRQGIEAAR